jgi:DNA-binding transcriptional MerR regulator
MEELKSYINLYQSGEFHQNMKLYDTKEFTIKDIGVQHHVIIHWDKVGLLFEKGEFGKWRRFNLLEFVWIRMIMKMRDYKVPLDKVKILRDGLFEQFSPYALNPIEIESTLQAIFESDMLIDRYDKVKDRPELKDALIAFTTCPLEMLILDILNARSQISLLLNLKGEVQVMKASSVDQSLKNDEFKEFFSKSYLSISITEILSDFIASTEPRMSQSLAVLNDSERMILEASRIEGIKELTIRYNEVPNGGKSTHIEYTYDEFVKKGQRIEDIILKEGYQTITIKTQKGNIVNCTNTVMKKIVRTE